MTMARIGFRSGIVKTGAFNVGKDMACQREETGMKFSRIAFLASDSPEARKAVGRLTRRHGNADPDSADVVVALGGDGHMLHILHRFVSTGTPIYGMNRGTIGFLISIAVRSSLRTSSEATEFGESIMRRQAQWARASSIARSQSTPFGMSH